MFTRNGWKMTKIQQTVKKKFKTLPGCTGLCIYYMHYNDLNEKNKMMRISNHDKFYLALEIKENW